MRLGLHLLAGVWMHRIMLCGLSTLFLLIASVDFVRSDTSPAYFSLNAYLIAQEAERRHDYGTAALHYRLLYKQDPENLNFLRRTLLFSAVDGDLESAVAVAPDVIREEKGDYLSRLLVIVDDLRARRYEVALRRLAIMRPGDPLVGLAMNLLEAWARQGMGDIDRALALLSAGYEQKRFSNFYAYHAALIADLSGRRDEARMWFDRADPFESELLRILDAYGHFLAREGDPSAMEGFLSSLEQSVSFRIRDIGWKDAVLSRVVPGPVVKDTREGIAEILYTLGIITLPDRKILPVAYFQLGLHLVPDAPFLLCELGHIYGSWQRRDKAISFFMRVPETSSLWSHAALQRARLHVSVDRAKAVSLLENLVETRSDNLGAIGALGHIYVEKKQFKKAIDLYSAFLRRHDAWNRDRWELFYWRGIAHELSGDWEAAEADFKEGLKNALGGALLMSRLSQGWVRKGMHLQSALSVLRKVAAAEPENAEILDSLGWCYYRMGSYRVAVRHLERAVELAPLSAVANDHLGDAYWEVGRRLEARYQWERALRLAEESEEKSRIEEKLKPLSPDGGEAGPGAGGGATSSRPPAF